MQIFLRMIMALSLFGVAAFVYKYFLPQYFTPYAWGVSLFVLLLAIVIQCVAKK